MVIMKNSDYRSITASYISLIDDALAFSAESRRLCADICTFCDMVSKRGDISDEDVKSLMQSMMAKYLAEKKLLDKLANEANNIVSIDKKVKKL